MRIRAVHLACFMLLLSAIASAEARGSRAQTLDPHVRYASYLMQQGSAAVVAEDAFPCGTTKALKLDLPVGHRAQVKTVWAMWPPSDYGTALQAFTGNRA